MSEIVELLGLLKLRVAA